MCLPKYLSVITVAIILFTSCQDSRTYAYRPTSYPRIEIEAPIYKRSKFDKYPLSFQLPQYIDIDSTLQDNGSLKFINIRFYKFNATLYLTYTSCAKDSIDVMVAKSEHIVSKMQVTADDIIESTIDSRTAVAYGKSYGLNGREIDINNRGAIYTITGDVASTQQFFITDGESNFLRGSLYFDNIINQDSLTYVIDRVTDDVDRIILTTQWKNGSRSN